MKPYEIVSHIIDQTIAEQLATDDYMLLYFPDYIRYNHALASTDPASEPYMWLYHKFLTGNYRYHNDWKLQAPYSGAKGKKFSKLNFIDHSWEPVNQSLDNLFWQDVKAQSVPNVIIHSEHHSKDILDLNIPEVHWFSHAYICSEIYFKHYKKLRMVTDYKSRPINYPWISANRLLRKHRTDFLELLDLSRGCYSLLNPDPNGLTYNGPVQARSFDDHSNSSAELKVDDLTPWNTSFLHIVNETIWQDKIHFTEKIFKPIVMHQPFVVLQAPGSLSYLRSYGFKTFGDWWDESYDTIEDPQQRMKAIANIVNTIGHQNLYQLRDEMAGVLEHNFRHFYENIPAICLNELSVGISLIP